MLTGAYDPVPSDEKPYISDSRYASYQRSLWKQNVTLHCLASLAVGIAIGFVGAYAMGAVSHPRPVSASPSSLIPASVFHPRLPTVMRPDERYVGWSSFVNKNWMYLVRSSESIYIDENPEEHDLGPGFESPFSSHQTGTNQFYHVSNLHQLHCLNILRISYYHMTHNISEATPDDDAQASYHFEHCVEYLRQGIMCGDHFEIEGASPPGALPEEVVDAWGNPLGWGITKNCVNWDNLMSWQRAQLKRAG